MQRIWNNMSIRVSILTISDRSYKGVREDLSGPALAKAVTELGWIVVDHAIVPDEKDLIIEKLIEWSDAQPVDIILTTGGTGFAPRDITPEATQSVIQRNAPGIVEAMRSESLKLTPHAILSRSCAGIRNKTIIINLPGSPKAAVENFQVVCSALPHAVKLTNEDPSAESEHRPPIG
jgi:molybdopterin adenylyltransferase